MRKEKRAELERLIEQYQTVKQSEVQLVNGRFLQVGSANYALANGRQIQREEIIKNNGYSSASIILPITESEDVILIIQPRVLTKNGVAIELPAGYLDADEVGVAAAIRELREETGYVAKKITKLTEFYQDAGCSRALNECFLATGCQLVSEQALDGDEMISLFACKYDEMLELVDQNYINDAGSIITIEKANRLLLRR